MSTIEGKFYSWFEDERLTDAVKNHSPGYGSVEEAVADSQALEEGKKGLKFKVLDHNLNVVFQGEIQ